MIYMENKYRFVSFEKKRKYAVKLLTCTVAFKTIRRSCCNNIITKIQTSFSVTVSVLINLYAQLQQKKLAVSYLPMESFQRSVQWILEFWCVTEEITTDLVHELNKEDLSKLTCPIKHRSKALVKRPWGGVPMWSPGDAVASLQLGWPFKRIQECKEKKKNRTSSCREDGHKKAITQNIKAWCWLWLSQGVKVIAWERLKAQKTEITNEYLTN